jgi:putative addiction module killer protein
MAGLKDAKTAAIIAANIEKLRRGLGDIEPVGEGVSEIRIDCGAGYRVYFGELAGQLIVLLVGGTKRRQQVDIDAAKSMFKELKKQATAKATVKSAASNE